MSSEDRLSERLARFVERARVEPVPSRHEEVVETVRSDDVSHELAEAAYIIAEEVGLEPYLALQLVACGIGVRDFGEPEADVPAADPTEPEWVEEDPRIQAAVAEEERRLRATYRRLRSSLAEHPTRERALAAFAEEPDLEAYDY